MIISDQINGQKQNNVLVEVKFKVKVVILSKKKVKIKFDEKKNVNKKSFERKWPKLSNGQRKGHS